MGLEFEDSDFETARRQVRYYVSWAFTAFAVVVGAYAIWFGPTAQSVFSLDQAVWGQFGDFFGGVLNPVLGLVTVVLVALAYLTQKKELAGSIRALADSAQAQERLADISILQSKISAESTLLERRTNAMEGIRSEMSRIASILHHQGVNPVTVFTIEGDELTDHGKRRAYIMSLLPKLRDRAKDAAETEKRLNELTSQLSKLYKQL